MEMRTFVIIIRLTKKQLTATEKCTHTHTHKVENGVLRVLYIHVQYWRGQHYKGFCPVRFLSFLSFRQNFSVCFSSFLIHIFFFLFF
jgi:hypothetical protein